MTYQLFVSASGDMLPRWREAFPAARSVALNALTKPLPAPAMVWLRLDANKTMAEQVALVHARIGPAPLIVMSDIPNDDEALAAFSVSAKGYCNAHAIAELLQQIEAVVRNGGLWIGEGLIHRMLGSLHRIPAAIPSRSPNWEAALTDREREVAQAICSGASNKEVARQLQITERTVKAHVGSIFEKLKVRDRLQLALLIKEQVNAEQ
ncbi:response regulator transcription factor [Noviherbaspirillum sp. UKPF54]|uniref:response regulator transcription factor n=1 Tax=Noviherbaspirillum sp. UKPF54 TaxID=2601898 RepID=UPI0011B16AE4|nr:response regulator transcription factor [Noviherbaspirillum sp. UKPF54]QDZ29632.1 response regulator transcription factor [Noviherbaspirillum sp. UKPF54]